MSGVIITKGFLLSRTAAYRVIAIDLATSLVAASWCIIPCYPLLLLITGTNTEPLMIEHVKIPDQQGEGIHVQS